MKKLILFISTMLFSANINIEVSGIQNSEGALFVGLFNSAENFPKKEFAYQSVAVHVNSNILKYQFENIPNGIYSIAIFHDTNSNGILDKNFVGMPTESYGFSNNARGLFGPPSFDEAKFELIKNTNIKVEVK